MSMTEDRLEDFCDKSRIIEQLDAALAEGDFSIVIGRSGGPSSKTGNVLSVNVRPDKQIQVRREYKDTEGGFVFSLIIDTDGQVSHARFEQNDEVIAAYNHEPPQNTIESVPNVEAHLPGTPALGALLALETMRIVGGGSIDVSIDDQPATNPWIGGKLGMIAAR
jgi:hypothetical protein